MIYEPGNFIKYLVSAEEKEETIEKLESTINIVGNEKNLKIERLNNINTAEKRLFNIVSYRKRIKRSLEDNSKIRVSKSKT